MSQQHLFDNLDDLIRTPKDVARLNAAIWDLAVQGKLVRQVERDQLASKQVIQHKQQPHSTPALFAIPESWLWIQLEDLKPQYQNGCSRRNPAEKGASIPVLRLADITNYDVDLSRVRYLTIPDQEIAKYDLKQDDILITRVNGSSDLVGAFTLIRTNLPALYCDHFIRIRIDRTLAVSRYLVLAAKSKFIRDQVSQKFITTAGQKTVNQTHVGGLWFPLPPLAEQHRIVAKVDELLAQTRALEANLRRAQEEIVVVNQAALHRLETAEDGESLHAAWRTVADAFDLLYDDPRPLAALRQTILRMAVSGKLVRQDERDEPAKELVKKVRARKLQTIKRSRVSKKSELNAANNDDQPVLAIPPNWTWTKVGTLAESIQYGYTASADGSSLKYRLLRITDIQGNKVNWASVPGCVIDDAEATKYLLECNDILIARTGGTIGKSFLVMEDPPPAVFASYLIRVVPPTEVDARFLKVFLESPLYWSQLLEESKGTGQPNVNSVALGNLDLPLPPLAEQQRIVAKVDELFGMCDALERKLGQSAVLQQAAVESVLAHVVQGA